MSDPTTISVIVVSQGRPDYLRRCLLGLAQQYYENFEIIVVADAAGCGVAADHGSIKIVLYEAGNISAARNLGIAQAAGNLIAFIDDDAVAEPTWLTHLAQPFDDPVLAAATGYVRGRNGISFQWQGRMVDGQSLTRPLETTNDAPQIVTAKDGWVLKLEGTNMMFRADILRGIGGFDERFHFYLDETDLGMRLGLAGHKMALCPMAQVHHGFAASARRAINRAPKSLFEIGASLAIYLRKYQPDANHLNIERMAQRKRLLHLMVAGDLAPDQINPLLQGFDDGVKQATARKRTTPKLACDVAFSAFATQITSAPTEFLSGRPWQRASLMRRARSMLANGQRVHVIILSPTTLFHRIEFDVFGIWIQRGGIFGRASRDEPLFSFASFKARAAREMCNRKTLQHPKIPQ